MNNLTSDILSICSIPGDSLISSRQNITYTSFIAALLNTYQLKEAAQVLNISTNAMNKLIGRHVSKTSLGSLKPKDVYWKNYLLNLCNLKDCNKCNSRLPLTQYVKSSDTWDGLQRTCRKCKAIQRKQFTANNPNYAHEHYIHTAHVYKERAARYKANRLRATPCWTDQESIVEFYKNCPEGFHVDHIYPLQSDWVCGLHVIGNLQYLSQEENLKKGNRYMSEYHS